MDHIREGCLLGDHRMWVTWVDEARKCVAAFSVVLSELLCGLSVPVAVTAFVECALEMENGICVSHSSLDFYECIQNGKC